MIRIDKTIDTLLGTTSGNLGAVCTVSVPESGLRRTFDTLKNLFKFVEISKSIKFQVYGGRLFLSANVPSGYYERSFPAPDADNISVVCKYSDISGILRGNGKCEIALSLHGVTLTTATSFITMTLSADLIDEVDIHSASLEPLDAERVSKTLKSSLSLNAYSKAYKTGASYICARDYFQVRYPTLWAEFPFTNLETVLDGSTARLLNNFLYSAKNAEYGQVGEVLVFKVQDEFLAITVTPVTSSERLKDFLQGGSFLGEVDARGMLATLKDFKATVLDAECMVELYAEGASFAVENANMNAGTRVGKISETLIRFEISIDMLINIFEIVGYKFSMYAKDGKILFSSEASVVFTSKS